MNTQQAIQWMNQFNEKIQQNKDYLSQLDTPIGDGDHGGNLSRGMQAVVDHLGKTTFANVQDVFKAVAMQLLGKVGGASGPLYGSAFMGMAQATSHDLPTLLQAGLEMIQKRGKAQVGEKTMVDVWAPVIEQLREGALTPSMIDDYVQATKELQATKGRASYVGERSIGHIDPGAYSSGLLFAALLEVRGD